MNNPPFRTNVDAAWCADPAHRVRWERTLDFVRNATVVSRRPALGLDAGDRTPMTGMLEGLFGCPFDVTTTDLDTGSLDGSYQVVTAFEVLEHLYNPLHFLLEVRRVLAPGGHSRLFLSTPAWKPPLLQSPEHFHEMPRRSLESLLHRAGLTTVRRAVFRIRPATFYLTGFRPLLRAVFEKIVIYELAPDA